MFRADLVSLPLEVIAPMLTEKLRRYADLFDVMDSHGGWLIYPDSMLTYLKNLGATHWADLYFLDGAAKWQRDREPQIAESCREITDAIGSDPSTDSVNSFLSEFATEFCNSVLCETGGSIPGLEFLESEIEDIDLDRLTEEQLQQQHDVWVTFYVNFYNDLALATHGESIFSLVSRAVDSRDDEALVMALQIDRTLMPYFQERLWDQSMRGDSDFFDSLAYRVNNPPRKGTNKHPLLWVLFNDLHTLRCFQRSVTSKQILNLYQKAVQDHPKFAIVDDLVVQRQRRKFMKKSRQVK